jgi:hypothetical protein
MGRKYAEAYFLLAWPQGLANSWDKLTIEVETLVVPEGFP